VAAARRALALLTPPVRGWVTDTFGTLTPPQAAAVPVLPAFSDWAGGTAAGRLLDSLPPDEWRALPITHGAIVDLGIVVRGEPR
jgi:hypothetical protein